MLNLFDSYVRHSRVYPAVLVSLPYIFTWYSFSSFFDDTLFIRIGNYGLVIIVITVLMSYMVRYFGKRIEPKLWKAWEGAPSTRYLRKNDLHFATETKQKLYNKIKQNTGIDLNEEPSDDKYIQAFSIIRNELRKTDKEGLWRKFNKEYGFSRNLLGSRFFWIVSSFCLFVTCMLAIKFLPETSNIFIIGSIFNFFCGVVGIVCGFFIFPDLTKKIAERYAEDALLSYLNL